MKKVLILFLIIIVCCLTACSGNSNNDKDDVTTKNSKETKATTKEEKCKDGHSEVIDNAVTATCTQSGLTEGKHCSVCDEIIVEQQTVNPFGHTPVTLPGFNATCVSSGKTDGSYCAVCNAVLREQQDIAATGHSLVTIPGYQATCVSDGLSDGSRCAVCNVVTEGQYVIGATGHYDNGSGYCSYCGVDVFLETLKSGLNVQLLIPSVGTVNSYCQVRIENRTDYNLGIDATFAPANGYLFYNPDVNTVLESYYSTTITYYRDIPTQLYKTKDAYLDYNSEAYINVKVNGRTVFIKFNASGPVRWGYSLNDIGEY